MSRLWFRQNWRKLVYIGVPVVVTVVALAVLLPLVIVPKIKQAMCTLRPITLDDVADKRYTDAYRGWYKSPGCRAKSLYCGWGGAAGSGGDPFVKTSHVAEDGKESTWSCSGVDKNGKTFWDNYATKNFALELEEANP